MREHFDAKRFVSGLPNLPGVYRMLGAAGEVLYVGKAADLKKRVGSYFAAKSQSPRLEKMLSQVAAIEVTVTRSESEALLLENNLIKSLAPRYNILFRDDKSYPYLVLTGHRFPRLEFRRGARERSSLYFGPFAHAHAVRESIQILQRVFRLRTCEDTVFENRSRPCLLYQIDRCSAPCTGRIDAASYAQDAKGAELFLRGQGEEVLRMLEAKMQSAAAAQRYEEAARYRDRIRALARVQARQYVECGRGLDADVVACTIEEGIACVNLVMIRGGRHVGDRSLFPHNAAGASAAEILSAFLGQHYLDQPPPPQIVTAVPVEFSHPDTQVLCAPQGERRVWVEMAEKNARLAASQRARERRTQETRLGALREALALPETAARIECFDVSHTRGEATVAACVVYDRTALQRAEYRRFNIRGVIPGDDCAALRQALGRRFARLIAEGGRLPDLVLVDGGRAQLAAARAALAELGVDELPVVGVAKGAVRRAGEETLVLECAGRVLRLPPEHPGLHLVQAIRDEAHRFAIAGHRAGRTRMRMASALAGIPGVGARRRQKLLAHFGGLQGVQAAAVDELAKVSGVSRALAERIYRHLHG